MITEIKLSKIGLDMSDIKEPHIIYRVQDVDAIKKAMKINGIVDVIKPDYFVELSFEDQTTAGYYLWLRSEGGSIMNQKDTNTLYTLPSKIANDLKKFVL